MLGDSIHMNYRNSQFSERSMFNSPVRNGPVMSSIVESPPPNVVTHNPLALNGPASKTGERENNGRNGCDAQCGHQPSASARRPQGGIERQTPVSDPARGADCPAPRYVPPDNDRIWSPTENVGRCAGVECGDAFLNCTRIGYGSFSSKSRAQPVFSHSEWKGGYLVKADCSIIRAIAWHIDQTKDGDEVLIAISSWGNEAWGILNSVLLASQRGVSVKVVCGNGTGKASWAVADDWIRLHLDEHLGSGRVQYWTTLPNVYFVDGGSNISHNKFVLIRTNSPDRSIVLIGGANWRAFDISRNCDLLAVDNNLIWKAFRKYWENGLWKAAKFNPQTVDYDSFAYDVQAGVSAHIWPRLVDGVADKQGNTAAKNPWVEILKQFKKGKSTKIRIIAATWKDGAAVTTELIKHRKAGSDVRVIGNHHRDLGCHNFTNACSVTPGKPEKSSPCETREEVWTAINDASIPWAKAAPHAKTMLISGPEVDGGVWRSSVYTGSMNMSFGGNMPDAFIGIHNDLSIFFQYEQWWSWLCKNTAMNWGGSTFGQPVCGTFVSL